MKNCVSVATYILMLLLWPRPIWAVMYAYHVDYHNNGGFKILVDSWANASHGLDVTDMALNPPSIPSSDIGLTIYKQPGVDGWDGNPGCYVSDGRPLLNPGETETVSNIYLWGGTRSVPQNLELSIYSFVLTPGVTYCLRLVSVPNGVDYRGKTQWGPNHETISLPYFATDDPAKGYRFEAVFTAVPEPSSLAALGGGVMGLLALRRRRR